MRKIIFLLFFLSLFFASLPVSAEQDDWFLLSRDNGCVGMEALVKMENLSRAPESPEDFAQMMIEKGEKVSVGPLPDSPPELAGKIVQVKVGKDKAFVFAKKEICGKV